MLLPTISNSSHIASELLHTLPAVADTVIIYSALVVPSSLPSVVSLAASAIPLFPSLSSTLLIDYLTEVLPVLLNESRKLLGGLS